MGGENGSGGGGSHDLLSLEPPSDLKPAVSPISDTSATLQSDNNDTLTGKLFSLISKNFLSLWGKKIFSLFLFLKLVFDQIQLDKEKYFDGVTLNVTPSFFSCHAYRNCFLWKLFLLGAIYVGVARFVTPT